MGTPPVVDANGDLVVLNGALRSGFRTISGETKAAAIPTPVPALLAAGRTGPALSLAPSGSVGWPALLGPVSKTVRAAEFWAKAVTASTVNASTGATNLGLVTLIADGAWHRYVLPFPTDVSVGSPVFMFVAAVGVGPNLPVIFDIVTLVARPFETVSLSSNNGFEGLSFVTATVTGLWSADSHFMSAMRTSDGLEACAACSHVSVPASGSVSFPLSPGVYRIVVETGDTKSTVGVSPTFTINIATTTTTTTTTTTLPVFPVSIPDVYNGYGEVVVLDDAFRSGFRDATSDGAATPIVARATQGRSNAAMIFNPGTDAIRGLLKGATTGIRFWAKVSTGTAPSMYALVGGAAAGTVALTPDGAWREYTLPFSYTRSAGQELILLGSVSGSSTFLLDDMGLVNPPPPPITTIPAPNYYYVNQTVVDWQVHLYCWTFRNFDTGSETYDCFFTTSAGLPPDLGRYDAFANAEAAVLATGATDDDPYRLKSVYGDFTKTKVISVRVEGPPPPYVPPTPTYPDWGVTLVEFSPTVFGFNTRFGSPPFLGQFTARITAIQAIVAAGGVDDAPPGGYAFTRFTTVAPTTTLAPATTTTSPPPVTVPTRPAAFSTYPNYLRSQKLMVDGVTNQCLAPGSSSIQSLAASCTAGNALLSFTGVNQGALSGYLVKQGSTCLQVDYNAPDRQVLLADGSPALKIGWVPCGSTGDDTVWVPSFVGADPTSAGWYQLVPKYSRGGIANPCLNLNLGASAGTQMLVEYTCQGGTHTEENWAPNESFWTAPPGTGGGGTGGGPSTTLPPVIPSGGARFGDGATTIKSALGDNVCVSFQGDSDVTETGICDEFFVARLVPGGYIFQRLYDSKCLTSVNLSLVLASCSELAPLPSQVFQEGVFGSDTYSTLVLVSNSLCMAATTPVSLRPCDSSLAQQWTDPEIDREDIVELPPPGLNPAETEFFFEVARGALVPASAFSQVWDAFKPYCGLTLKKCIGSIFKYFNFVHAVVQFDLARKIPGGAVECRVGTTRLRIDVCGGGYAGEVKPNFAPSVVIGQGQLADYILKDPTYQIASPLAWGFSTNSGLIPIPWGTIQYNFVGGGVWGYTVSNIPALPDFVRALDSETSRQLARSWVDALSKPLPLSVVNAASAKALVSAMRNEGYSSASVSFELFRRYETSIAAGIKHSIVGVSVMGALAALLWFVAESR